MSANPTTVKAIRAELVTLFKAAVEEPTEVWAQPPNEDHQEAENVYLGPARGTRKFKTFPATQPLSREENYTIQVTVEVIREGNDPAGCEERMWTIANALEAAVAENPTLGSNLQSGIAAGFEQSIQPTNDGHLARYMFSVGISARI